MRFDFGAKTNYSRRSREVQDVQGLLLKIFAITNFGIRKKSSDYDTEKEPHVDHNLLSSRCLGFMMTLTKSPHLFDHILHIRRMDERTRRLLKGTVLVSEVSVAYFHIFSATQNLLQNGIKNGRYDNNNLYSGSKCLVSHLDS